MTSRAFARQAQSRQIGFENLCAGVEIHARLLRLQLSPSQHPAPHSRRDSMGLQECGSKRGLDSGSKRAKRSARVDELRL